METRIFKDNLAPASELLKNGSLVAVPTETVYGLAGNGLDEKAVREIYEVKGRPEIKPLSLMVSGPEDMEKYCLDVSAEARALAEKFWPGPLTIVLKARDSVPQIVRAGGSTVGLRCPDHKMTLELLKLSGIPFAAPSANPSGEESPKSAEKVREYFDGKISGIVDGGECSLGRESTLIDMSGREYKILRQGALSEADIADALVDEMTVIGITGGTGCGKTTALNTLREKGALIVDCDRVYHELLDNSTDMLSELKEAFPEAFPEGKFQRHELGFIVFSNAPALETLNEITHKYVRSEVRSLLRGFAMKGGKLAALDAVELISSGLGSICDYTVGVIAQKEKRMKRIMARDNIDMSYAMLRINSQREAEYYKEQCSYVIENNGTEEEFIKEFTVLTEEAAKNGRKKG